MRKKRVLFLTDYAGVNTGFGKNIKLLLTYLYKTKKYELFHAACGVGRDNPEFQKFPWKTIGVIPNDQSFISRMQQDQHFARMASYGEPEIAKIVEETKPDVIFAIQDSWGALFVADKPFFKKIPTVCWITFDSLPLLPDTVEKASKIANYWTWSDFAENEFHKLGFDHVKTQYPLTNTDNFYPLSENEVLTIKQQHGIEKDCKIFGFVFRNQLRKLVGTLISGYSEFLKQNPEMSKKTKLLLHTHFAEGWDIMRFAKQYGVPEENILCTYICKETYKYFILPYAGQDIENPTTKRKTLITTNVSIGVTDSQLNEIYNIMDAYLHPATSGACEIPIVEAALAEKIVSTCDYSFGWNVVNHNKGCIPMDYSLYNEPPMGSSTQFLKSQPYPSSISKIMKKICEMKKDRKKEMERHSREWALKNYSVSVNGEKIENFIDSQKFIEDEQAWVDKEVKNINPKAQIQNIDDDLQWVLQLYSKILDTNPDLNDDGVRHWMMQIERGMPRQNIELYFRDVANKELQKENPQTLDVLFDSSDKLNKLKRLLIVQPQSAGDIFIVTSLLESIRSKFTKDKWKIYFACEPKFFEILAGNENIDKIIPYNQIMDNQIIMEGHGDHNGYVDICLNPYFSTQKLLNYTHNSYSISQFDHEFKK
jgi:glycosyltransferase involved in cell wall biosynthesis